MNSAIPTSEPSMIAPGVERSAINLSELEASGRMPLFVLFASAAVALLIGSILGIIAAIKFHQPAFMADAAWLTYGRVRPAYTNSLLYGFCVPAGLGVALWVFARLGRAFIAQPILLAFGAAFWNFGVTVGILGILAGDSTGYETLEMPRYATPILFLAYMIMGVWALVTFHRRRYLPLFVSQWFLLAALFGFRWIYATGTLLLEYLPVRGVAQPIIAWWYSANLQTVWLGLVGLGVIFYFVPKLSGRDLHSYYLALFTFWFLLFFGSFTGIPATAPIPAWVPALSGSATMLLLIPLIAFALNMFGTLNCVFPDWSAHISLRFIWVAAVSFVVSVLMILFSSFAPVGDLANLTWFTVARTHVQVYGFFAIAMFGAIYYILPRVAAIEFLWPRLIGVHFWLATIGIVLIVLPLGIGGIIQGLEMRKASIPFLEILRTTLMFLRISTLGDLMLFAGHVIFLLNILGLLRSFFQTRATAAYRMMTAEVKPSEVAL